MAFSLSRSLFARMTASSPAVVADADEGSFSHVLNRDLYKQRERVSDDDWLKNQEPFPLLSGENIEYIGCSYEDHIIVLSNYRLFATGPNGFYSIPLGLVEALELQTSKVSFNVVCKDARICRLYFSSVIKCRAWFDRLLECRRRSHKDTKSVFAFIYRAYRKDEKMSRLWSESGVDGIPLSNMAEFEETRSESGGDGRLVSLPSDPFSWREEMMTSDYRRMGLCPGRNGNETRTWRISQCNDKYEVCPTYPKLLMVPSLVSDEELSTAAKFRMSGRLPVVSWRHQSNGCVIVRSSQPLVGVLGWRNPTDEKLLMAFSQSCSQISHSQSNGKVFQNGGGYHANGVKKNGISLLREESEEFYSDSDEEGLPHFDSEDELGLLPKLKVFDLRSYTAALGNRAKGGGCECADYYPNCEIFYKGLPNIHTVRKSFQQMRQTLNSEDQTNFLSNLESTQWLSYLCQLLSVACEVVGVVNNDHTPCPLLVHCSDGWDRTTQIITLAELMLDPYYRTIKGFRVLVEREWVGFGHRFADRCGHVTEDMNSRSPIFLQWLDCVYQLMRQCPCDFQFNENFLVKLGEHCFSCLYGTFLCNSMKERETDRVAEDTHSVWSLLHEGNIEVVNYLYKSGGKRIIYPVTHIKYMLLWKEMYVSPLLSPYHTRGGSNVMDPPSLTQPVPIERLYSQQPPPNSATGNVMESINSNYQSFPNSPTSRTEVEPKSEPEWVESERKPKSLESEKDTDLSASSQKLESQEKLKEPEAMSQASENKEIAQKESSSPPSEGSEVTSTHSLSPPPPYSQIDQTPALSDAAGQPDDSLHKECGESHENLHLKSESNGVLPQATEAMSIGNGHMPLKTDTEQSHSNQNSQPHISSKPQLDNPVTSSSSQKSTLEHTLSPTKACNGGLLHEAINDVSPCKAQNKEVSVHPTRTAIGSRLGVDGLPLICCETQERVRELVVEPQKEVKRLRGRLKELQLFVHKQGVSSGGVGLVEGVEGGSIEEQISSALEDQSPTSLGSWDCVEREEGGGVRWVPDHAVSHCQGCGSEFWTGLRKHHCRSCGGVFCGSCSNFFCPVPHEQLFQEMRVCEKCFYKLDGHLRAKDSLPIPPT